MKVIVPIQNLTLDETLEIGNIKFFPKLDASIIPNQDIDDIETSDTLSMRNMANFFSSVSLSDFLNLSVAVLDYNFTKDQYFHNKPNDDEMLLRSIVEEVDRALDFVRIIYCNPFNKKTLPGFPALLPSGFDAAILINNYDDSFRFITAEIHGFNSMNGLGLSIENNLENDKLGNFKDFYQIITDNRKDDVILLCRSAIKRINESMYMNNLDTSFIYLMSTLEMIASDKFIKFEKVKSKIIPFIANDKKSYHKLSEELKRFSKEVRTDVVHNGKPLHEVAPGDYERLLFKLQGIILTTIENMFKTGIESLEELEIYRSNKIESLEL